MSQKGSTKPNSKGGDSQDGEKDLQKNSSKLGKKRMKFAVELKKDSKKKSLGKNIISPVTGERNEPEIGLNNNSAEAAEVAEFSSTTGIPPSFEVEPQNSLGTEMNEREIYILPETIIAEGTTNRSIEEEKIPRREQKNDNRSNSSESRLSRSLSSSRSISRSLRKEKRKRRKISSSGDDRDERKITDRLSTEPILLVTDSEEERQRKEEVQKAATNIVERVKPLMDKTWWALPGIDVPPELYGECSKSGSAKKHRICLCPTRMLEKFFATFVVDTAIKYPKEELIIYGNGLENFESGVAWQDKQTKICYKRVFPYEHPKLLGKYFIKPRETNAIPKSYMGSFFEIPLEHVYYMALEFNHKLTPRFVVMNDPDTELPDLYDNYFSRYVNASRTPPIRYTIVSLPTIKSASISKPAQKDRERNKHSIRRRSHYSHRSSHSHYHHRRSSKRSPSSSRHRTASSHTSLKSKNTKSSTKVGETTKDKEQEVKKEDEASILRQIILERAHPSLAKRDLPSSSTLPPNNSESAREKEKEVISFCEQSSSNTEDENHIKSIHSRSHQTKKRSTSSKEKFFSRISKLGKEFSQLNELMRNLSITPSYRQSVSEACTDPNKGIEVADHFRVLATFAERRICGRVFSTASTAATLRPSELPKNLYPEDIARCIGVQIKNEKTENGLSVPMYDYKGSSVSVDALKAASKRETVSFFPPIRSHPPREEIPNDDELYRTCLNIERHLNRQYAIASAIIARDAQMALTLVMDDIALAYLEWQNVMTQRKTDKENKVHLSGEDAFSPLTVSELRKFKEVTSEIISPLFPSQLTPSLTQDQVKKQAVLPGEKETNTNAGGGTLSISTPLPQVPPPSNTFPAIPIQPAFAQSIQQPFSYPYPFYPSPLGNSLTPLTTYPSEFFRYRQSEGEGTHRRRTPSPENSKQRENPKRGKKRIYSQRR
jgi:hypothetical protein